MWMYRTEWARRRSTRSLEYPPPPPPPPTERRPPTPHPRPLPDPPPPHSLPTPLPYPLALPPTPPDPTLGHNQTCLRANLAGSFDVVHHLLSRGASVGPKPPHLRTPLHAALTLQRQQSAAANDETLRVIELLINAGSDLDARDRNGISPMDMATGSSNPPSPTPATPPPLPPTPAPNPNPNPTPAPNPYSDPYPYPPLPTAPPVTPPLTLPTGGHPPPTPLSLPVSPPRLLPYRGPSAVMRAARVGSPTEEDAPADPCEREARRGGSGLARSRPRARVRSRRPRRVSHRVSHTPCLQTPFEPSFLHPFLHSVCYAHF